MLTYDPALRFSFDPQILRTRLTRKVTRFEFAALALSLILIPVFLWLRTINPAVLSDYAIYLAASNGDFSGFYYAVWLLPFFKGLSFLPFWLSYPLYEILSIAGVFCFARLVRGDAALILLSYQSLYAMHYGQITGLMAGGLALLLWALSAKKWGWAGVGLLIASVKFQSSLPVAGLLLLFAPLTWRERLKVSLFPLLFAGLSFAIYPTWVMELIQRLQSAPANDFGSVSLWRYLGGAAVLCILPPLLLSLPAGRRRLPARWRQLLWMAALPLAAPYFQQADLIFLFPFFPTWAILAGNLGLLMIWLGWDALRLLTLAPAAVYFYSLALGLRRKPLPG